MRKIGESPIGRAMMKLRLSAVFGRLVCVIIGVVVGVALVFLNPFSKATPRAAAIASTGADGFIHETFVVDTKDTIAATHAGNLPLPPGPAGIPLLSEPSIAQSLALLVKLRNTKDEI